MAPVFKDSGVTRSQSRPSDKVRVFIKCRGVHCFVWANNGRLVLATEARENHGNANSTFAPYLTSLNFIITFARYLYLTIYISTLIY